MEITSGQMVAKRQRFNLKKEILKYLRFWYWIILSMLLFFIGAKLYLRYTTPQYLSKTTLQFPLSQTKNGVPLTDLTTLGNGLGGDVELQGETTAILSKPLLAKVTHTLNLNVSFFGIGAIKEDELYTASPLVGKIISVSSLRFSYVSYVISPSSPGFYELSEGPLLNNKSRFRLGDVITLPFGKVMINLKKNEKSFEPTRIVFRSTKNVVSDLEQSVSVVLPPDKGLLMELSMKGSVPAKSEDILNTITRQYNIEGVKDRNLEAQNTQDFINGRLQIISEDLAGIEGEKEVFKRNNQITDLDVQTNIAVSNSNDNIKQLVNYSTQLDLINSIFAVSSQERLLPSNMGLSNVTEEYITKYNNMLLTRDKTLKQATAQNPSVVQLNREINELRNLIRDNLMESKASLQVQIANLKSQLNSDQTKIYNFPKQERIFRGIERQQNLKEQLYLYLLQKREENAITLAVTAPKAKILNPAYTIGVISPKQQQIILGALLAGFLLPIFALYGKYASDNKVHTKDQLQAHIPNVSIIAEIPTNITDLPIIKKNDFTVFAESFRILTSNLKFILKSKEEANNSAVILVTSSIKGEGKTTVAVNTALTLAGASNVLLIGADIRNPQLHRFVNEHKTGLTDYLISDDLIVDSYIKSSNLHPNLDVLFSGAIAPNPNDLLDMKKFDDMILSLKNKYGYILLDSAPVMLVSDTLHLTEVSDLILYVVKSNYTDTEMLDFAREYQTFHNIRNISFVLNNVKPEDSRYGNKYGYGYYSDVSGKH